MLLLQDGDTWELGCNVCTCDGTTGIMDCAPRNCDQEVVCGENEKRVFGDSANQSGDSCCGYCGKHLNVCLLISRKTFFLSCQE